MIHVQHDDFDATHEYAQMRHIDGCGAVVTFIGLVREFSPAHQVFTLEHYPGMTESVLNKIEQEAHIRWSPLKIKIIHRVGELSPGDQIVFVGVSSAHRTSAFAACEFIIDTLKTSAPFWKKEGKSWVDAADEDLLRAKRWLK